MSRYNQLVGNALGAGGGWGQPGYGGYNMSVFGADPNGMADPNIAIDVNNGGGQWGPGGPGYGGPGWGPGAGYGGPGFFGPGCGGPPAVIDPTFRQRPLFSGVLGAQCGPLLQQQYLPFEDVGCVEDGCEVTIRAFPQVWGKIVRLILCDHEASSFVVTDARVGIEPLFAGVGVLPGCAFAPNVENALLSTTSFFPNQPVSITVRNCSGASAQIHPAAIVMAVSGGFPHLYGTPLGGC